MNYITLQNISKSYGDKILFEGLDFFINKGDKISLIAKNGSGKTTLLRIIAGTEGSDGDTAKVVVAKGVRVGYLDQQPKLGDNLTVTEAVFQSDTPMMSAVRAYEKALVTYDDGDALQDAIDKMDALKAWDYDNQVKQILAKLKITNLDAKINELSGGQQKRVALAKILIEEPELLILDEPTNHLDLEMIEWLEQFMKTHPISLFMVTHDRYFLDSVSNQILELTEGKLQKYSGNYADYLFKKSEQEQVEARTLQKNKKLLSRELEWMRRQPKARGTKAKSRVDGFYDLKEKTSKRVNNDKVEIEIMSQRLGKKIINFHNVYKSFGEKKILDKFNYKFNKGERVGIVGVNGAGKSSFLKILIGETIPDSGRIEQGDTVQIGYYSQNGLELKEDKRVVEVVKDYGNAIPLSNGRTLTASQLCERFLFDKEHQYTYVSKLSGGEQKRLYLLTILMQNPNFLILDEPTNDLDIMTLNVLEDFLEEFTGCLVVVTHDRYFMDKLIDHLFVFEGDGVVKDVNGNYTDYRTAQQAINSEIAKAAKAEKKAQNTVQQQAAAPKANANNLSFEEQKELKKLEKKIDQLEKRKNTLNAKFADILDDQDKMTELSKEVSAITDEIEEKEMRWMELVDKMEG